MSAWEVTETPTNMRGSRTPQPRLRSVAGRKGAPIKGLPFAVVVVVILAAGMIGLLGLNVYIQDEQMALNKAQKQAASLALEVSDKQAQVYAKSGPGQLAAAASALGMVPNPNPVFLDLRTGKIIGSPKAVTGDEMPALKQVLAAPTASSSPAASSSSSASASPSATAVSTPSASPTASPAPSAAAKA